MIFKNTGEIRGWNQNQNVYQREVLYQEVWSYPIIEVAKKYGVSDVAIHKVCKSMEIPTPPVGYWAKKKAGQEVPVPPLPPTTGPSVKYGYRTQKQASTMQVPSMPATTPFGSLKTSQKELDREVQKREEEKRQFTERKRKYNLEVAKIKALLNEAEDYDTACKIRALAMAAEQNGTANAEWIAWAKAKADWYDPTVAVRDECFGRRNHKQSAEQKRLKEYGIV